MIVNGRAIGVAAFAIAGGRIVEIDILADPERLARLDVPLPEAVLGALSRPDGDEVGAGHDARPPVGPGDAVRRPTPRARLLAATMTPIGEPSPPARWWTAFPP